MLFGDLTGYSASFTPYWSRFMFDARSSRTFVALSFFFASEVVCRDAAMFTRILDRTRSFRTPWPLWHMTPTPQRPRTQQAGTRSESKWRQLFARATSREGMTGFYHPLPGDVTSKCQATIPSGVER